MFFLAMNRASSRFDKYGQIFCTYGYLYGYLRTCGPSRVFLAKQNTNWSYLKPTYLLHTTNYLSFTMTNPLPIPHNHPPPALPLPPPSFLYGLLAGAILTLLCRKLSSILTGHFTTPSFQTRVKALNSNKLYHYHSLLPSTVHALVQIVGTVGVVLHGRRGLDYDYDYDHDYDNRTTHDKSPSLLFDERSLVTYGLTPLGPAIYMGIFVGYLLADTLSAPSPSDMEYIYIVHHLAASLCWTYAACHRILQPYALLLQFCELSTPLMNARQLLLIAGYPSSSKSVMGLSLLFFATFGMVRVATLPYIIQGWVGRDYDAVGTVEGVGWRGAVGVSVFVGIHAVLQINWFGMMCWKLWGMAMKKKTKKEE